MTAVAATLRSELIGLGGIVERNVYLTKRYFLWDLAFMVWTIANFGAAFALLAIASFSFIGIGMMTSVLPLISPEKGAQLGFVMQGMMLVVSGVYYPVSVMPHWMQAVAKISPATYALRGDRASIVDGAGLAWANVWPLLIIAVVAIPLGLAIFKRGERYAKKHGKLKRSG